MYGDLAPVPELVELLERHGTGYAHRYTGDHPRAIVALTMAKAFGAGGAIFLVPDAELRRRISTCGPTMIFSGPIQNPVLGPDRPLQRRPGGGGPGYASTSPATIAGRTSTG